MSVICNHEGEGVCPACADRAQRAGVERNHAEVWRQVEEIADSAYTDGRLPSRDRTIALDILSRSRGRREFHERMAYRIEHGK